MIGERGNGRDASTAELVRTSGAAERLKACGRYVGKCFGPVEHLRGDFVRVRDALIDLGYQDAVVRYVAGRGADLPQSEYDFSMGFPLEMDDAHADLWDEFTAIPLEFKWRDDIINVVTTVGKNEFEDKYLGGSSYTAAVVMGLKGTGSAVAGDTQASHAGWSEVGLANAPAYSGNRPTPSFSAASSGTKSTSSAVNYAFTSGGTVAGCFINQGGSATKDNTTGTLFSAGDFTGGSKTVANGDQLNVSWSLSV